METKIFYAVQHGDNFDWDNGAYDYAEAQEMAKDLSEEYPGEEIRIAYIDEEHKVCDKEDIVVDGTRLQDKIRAKKFAVIATFRGDMFEYLFDAKDEALEQAERDWDRLTTYDKNLHTEFVVCSCETEDGIIDWDTVNIIKDYKKRYENV